jgi:2-keto-4-pentenoate hydratase/2-oxohepta-3-ene-1,7-dioic acid hydratase in catechol pathway
MRLSLDGAGEVQGNTDEHVLRAPKLLALLSRHSTLFPGDVITLGRTRDLLTVPVEQRLPEGTALQASIEGIGEVRRPVEDERELPGDR